MPVAGWSAGKTWLRPVCNGADMLSNWLALLSSTKAYPTVGPLVYLVIGDVFSMGQLRCACRMLRGLFDWFCGDCKRRFQLSAPCGLPDGIWTFRSAVWHVSRCGRCCASSCESWRSAARGLCGRAWEYDGASLIQHNEPAEPTWTVQLQQCPKKYLSSRTLEGLGLVQAFLYVASGAESAYLPGVLAVWTGDVGNVIFASRANKQFRRMLQLWRCVRCFGNFVLDGPRPSGFSGSCSKLLAWCSRCSGCILLPVDTPPPLRGVCRPCGRSVEDMAKHMLSCPSPSNRLLRVHAYGPDTFAAAFCDLANSLYGPNPFADVYRARESPLSAPGSTGFGPNPFADVYRARESSLSALGSAGSSTANAGAISSPSLGGLP